MTEGFDRDQYYGYIIKGDLTGAMNYVKAYPEQKELQERYRAIFEEEKYQTYAVNAELNHILAAYQMYFRDVFYLGMDREAAKEKLRNALVQSLTLADPSITLEEMEENQLADAFREQGFFFLGGRTGGYYGPYIWRVTEAKTFDVALPDGVQSYTVNLLDGFLFKSWIDYLSFGAIGTGGWTDGDGMIHCVKDAYDFESENFQVSLLKHEAQHVRDLMEENAMASEDLEYRAKLVELIYSKERNLLKRFAREADSADKNNGHASASGRIMAGFGKKLSLDTEQILELPILQIQTTARMLFDES